jgi:hypothetical protein
MRHPLGLGRIRSLQKGCPSRFGPTLSLVRFSRRILKSEQISAASFQEHSEDSSKQNKVFVECLDYENPIRGNYNYNSATQISETCSIHFGRGAQVSGWIGSETHGLTEARPS